MPFVAFMVGVAYWPGIYGAPFWPRWWAIAVLLPVVSCLDPRRLDPVVMWACILGLAWAALTLVWTPHLFGGAQQLLFAVLLFGVMVAAAGCSDINRVLEWLAIGLSWSSWLVLWQMVSGRTFVPSNGLGAGLFYSPEVFAEVAAPLLVWAVWSFRYRLVPLLVVPVLVSQSRIAWFVAAIGLIAGWRTPSRWVRTVVTLVPLALAAVAIVMLKPGSSDHRVVLWGAAILSMTLPGRGLGWWYSAHPFQFEEYAHSDVLQTFVEAGVVGGAAIAAVGIVCLLRCRDRALRAAFIACCIEACVSFPLQLPASGFLVAALAGALAVRRPRAVGAESECGAVEASGARWPAAFARSMARLVGRNGRRLSAEPSQPQPAGVRAG